MLNEIRLGHVTDETKAICMSLERPVVRKMDGPIETVVALYARNVDVDRYNDAMLHRLPEDRHHTYVATDFGDARCNDTMAPHILHLRVGARVLYLKNELRYDDDHNLVNGSAGRVVDFIQQQATNEMCPVVEFEVPEKPGTVRNVVVRRVEFTFDVPGRVQCPRRVQASHYMH
ncbi:hypothetical protein K439DRAFT_1660890 [Ramaria rubella]|nr:hypothetical protein K439DRAFT_1660890 [Ramaria rubella]